MTQQFLISLTVPTANLSEKLPLQCETISWSETPTSTELDFDIFSDAFGTEKTPHEPETLIEVITDDLRVVAQIAIAYNTIPSVESFITG